MSRVLSGGFVAGLAALAFGIALVSASVVAAGDWWLARQPWIGAGLNSLVIGLALIHLAVPPLVFTAAARSPSRGLTATGLLAVVAVLGYLATGARGMPLEALVGLFVGGIVAVTAVMAWRQSQRAWISAASAALFVGLGTLLVAAWWWVISWGLPARVPGAGRPSPSLLEDAGTLIYSRPDLAVIVPGLPTLALIAFGVLFLLMVRPTRRPRPAAGAAVLT